MSSLSEEFKGCNLVGEQKGRDIRRIPKHEEKRLILQTKLINYGIQKTLSYT